MYQVLCSKSAFIFYIIVLLTELATKFGVKQTAEKGRSYLLPWADISGVACFIFLVFYSIKTEWWAFIALLIAYVILYKIFTLITSLRSADVKMLYAAGSKLKFFIIPLIILMFALVNK